MNRPLCMRRMGKRRDPAGRRLGARPTVEAIEQRLLLSTLTTIDHSGAGNTTATVGFAATDGTANQTVSALPVGVEGQVIYHSILGDVLTMNIWQGTHVSFLTPTSRTDLDPTVIARILATVDAAYEYYESATGAQPTPYPPNYYINGRDTIAVVDNTGGAGYSYLGYTGIELMTPYFNILYNGVKNNNQYDQVVFYELGRNFWLYGNQLDGNSTGTNIGQNSFTTGFAVLMRFLSLDSTGQAGGPYFSWTYAEFEQNVKNLVDEYVADPALNFNNTLAIGQGVPGSQLASTDLFASFLFRLGLECGGNAFYQSIWKEVAKLPAVTTDQGAIDNLFLAACYAAKSNLSSLFVDTWRWPISSAAQDQVAMLPGTPGTPMLDPASETGASNSSSLTRDNGSTTAPLIFDVSETGGSGDFFRLYDVTNPNQPVLIAGPAQATDGTLTVSGHTLTDGTHLIAATTATSTTSTESALSASTTITVLAPPQVVSVTTTQLHKGCVNKGTNAINIVFNEPMAASAGSASFYEVAIPIKVRVHKQIVTKYVPVGFTSQLTGTSGVRLTLKKPSKLHLTLIIQAGDPAANSLTLGQVYTHVVQ